MERKPDPRIAVIPDIHGHAKGEHKPFAEERPIPYTARMLFLWFFHACRRSSPRFLMVADHTNYLTFEDPAAVNLVRRALKLAQAGDLYGAAETAGVELGHAAVVSEGLRRGMRYSIGAEVDNDPRCRPDAQNIVDAMKPDGMIRSVHFLPITHPQHGENWMWAFDNPEFKEFYDVVGAANVWEIYMATLLDAIDKLPGNIVGHFYVPAKFGHWPEDAVLADYEDRFVAACAERGMAIEVNSRYFYKYFAGDDEQLARYRAAHLRLLGKAKAANVAIAVGSDAHSPKDQGNAFDTVLELLDEADVNEIAFPISGRLARVALRATDEIIKAHAAALAAPVAPRPTRPAEDSGEEDGDDDETAPESAPEPVAPEHVVAAVATTNSEATPAVAATPVATAPKRPSRAKPKEVVAAVTESPATESAIAAPAFTEPTRIEPDVAPAVAAAPKKRSHKKGGGAATALHIATEESATTLNADDAAVVVAAADSVAAKKVPEAPMAEATATFAEPEHAPEPSRAPQSEHVPALAPQSADEPTKDLEPTHAFVAPAPVVDHVSSATAEPSKAKAPARPAPVKRAAPPARSVPTRTTVKTAPAGSAAKPAPKTGSSKPATASATARKPVPKPAGKAARTSAPAKAARTATAPKKTAKSAAKAPVRVTAAKPAAAKSPAKKPVAKKPAAKAAARPAAKKTAAKKPTAKPTAKATKRSVAAKPVAKKKSAPKKTVAKKKTARGRR